MKTKHFQILIINFCALALLGGCANKKLALTETGFLSGYSGLVADEELEGMRIYHNPDINVKRRYTKILLAPVQFKLNSDVKEHEMSFDDRLQIANYFHEQLIDRLVADYEIVHEPGEGVMLFRSAITDVKPNKVFLNVHWSTTLIGGGIGGASLEAELVDSVTNERIMAFVDAKKGKTALQQPSHLIDNYADGLSKWGHTKQVLGYWAEVMVEDLNKLRDRDFHEVAEHSTWEKS